MFGSVDEASAVEEVPDVLDCVVVFLVRGADEVVEGDVTLCCETLRRVSGE